MTGLAIAIAVGFGVSATLALAASPPPVAASTPVRTEESPFWRELKPAQQTVLAPLQPEWSALDVRNKRKWVELAARFPTLSPAEQARVQARMSEWTRMTPAQRGEARLHYQQARQLGARERQERWDAYQALPPEEKQQLAERSAAGTATSAMTDPARNARGAGDRRPAAGASASGSGAAVVLSPAATRRPISPALVQATPGVTTTLIDRRPTPPEHQRLGTRIGASSDDINKTTLLPRHRRADAAARPVAAASAASGAAAVVLQPAPTPVPSASIPPAPVPTTPAPNPAPAPAPAPPAPAPYPQPAAIGR